MSDDGTQGGATPIFTSSRFWRDQDGAVTIDWVALTAFTIALGMGAAFYVATSVPHVADKLGDHLETTTIVAE